MSIPTAYTSPDAWQPIVDTTLSLDEWADRILRPLLASMQAASEGTAAHVTNPGCVTSAGVVSLTSSHETRAQGHRRHAPFPSRALSVDPWSIAALIE